MYIKYTYIKYENNFIYTPKDFLKVKTQCILIHKRGFSDC